MGQDPHLLSAKGSNENIGDGVAEVDEQHLLGSLCILTQLVPFLIAIIHRDSDLLVDQLGRVVLSALPTYVDCIHQGLSLVLSEETGNRND